MSLIGVNETVDNIDEAKLLGYFETVKGTFITKWAFLLHFLDEQGRLAGSRLIPKILDDLGSQFPPAGTIVALRQGNSELLANYMDDIVTSSIIGAWSVFEQLTKDLSNPNYAHNADAASVNYQRNDFGLSASAKNDLDVIYYVRNAILHYNGAYYAYRDIDRHYRGRHFRSVGHYGEKITIEPRVAWDIVGDIERYAMEAWTCYKGLHP
jgi:hypothetical protein